MILRPEIPIFLALFMKVVTPNRKKFLKSCQFHDLVPIKTMCIASECLFRRAKCGCSKDLPITFALPEVI